MGASDERHFRGIGVVSVYGLGSHGSEWFHISHDYLAKILWWVGGEQGNRGRRTVDDAILESSFRL